MGALLILFLVGIYIFVAVKVTTWVKSWWGKLAVISVFALIPTADAIYGRIKFNQMCETEAGLKIYKTVQGVEGFYNPKAPPFDEWIMDYGYKFIEGRGIDGKDARKSLQPDGSILLEIGIMPTSKYVYDVDKGDLSDINYRIEQIIRVKETNEILSKQVNINYAGGWFNRFVAGLYASRGQAGLCGPGISMFDLVTNTLKPIQ